MIHKILAALVVAAVVWLLMVYVLGPILVMLVFPVAVLLGHVCEQFGVLIGILSGLWYYFRG